MGRHAEGPRLKQHPRTGIWEVRFTHQGKRYFISTGERDRGKAEAKKGPIYTDIIKGRKRVSHISAPTTPLEKIFSQWLAETESEVVRTTYIMRESYAGRFVKIFPSLAEMTESAIADYRRSRLREVKRITVLKELSALRKFLDWCREQKLIDEVPRVEPPGKKVLGVPDTKRPHKSKAIRLTEEEAYAIIERIPEWSRKSRKTGLRFRLRDFFIVVWETGLRPVTVQRLSVPEHYNVGWAELHIEASIDKVRYERVVPITEACAEALARSAPFSGIIFGHHDVREALKNAVAAAVADGLIPKERGDAVSIYDFRHGRLTQLCSNTLNLAGVGLISGHTDLSTLSKRYVRAHEASAAEVLASLRKRPKKAPTEPTDSPDAPTS